MKKRYFFLIILIGLFISFLAKAQNSYPIIFTKTLGKGAESEEVKNLQITLAQLNDIYPERLVTGYFGPLTEAAVKKFQQKNNIVLSGTPATTGFGLVGPKTRKALNGLFVSQLRTDDLFGNGQGPEPPKTPISAQKPSPIQQPAAALAEKPYFSYSWRADDTVTGEIHLPTPAAKPVILRNGQKNTIPQSSSAVRLAEVHKIILSDEEEQWDDESATMLLETIQMLQDILYKFGYNKSWKTLLTTKELPNDVEIVREATESQNGVIRFSKKAFVYANPTIQESGADNSRKIFYSNQLYRATLRAFFNEHKLLETILKERYGVIPGSVEPADEFQDFTNEELQYLATVFEDLPQGFRHMPGLEKVVRRKNGLLNPVSPQAPAIAWVTLGYIEFMDIAFRSNSEDYIRRLITHELTHFVWHHILNEEAKRAFMKFSGWSLTMPVSGVKASSGTANDHPMGRTALTNIETWYRTSTANFISDYAAYHNPDEDFAETVSYYVYLPDKVRTFAPEKYNFVKDIIDGYEYVILVDEKYTFQVFNLHPDTTFPGKIVGTDIEVYKQDDSANKVIMTLLLSPKYGDGAEEAYARVVSPQGTYFDVYFYPYQGDAFTLRTELIIPKTASSGYWLPQQITVRDQADNRRQEGQAQFGWLLYINNQNEDLKPPVPDTNRITFTKETRDDEQHIKIFVPVTDEHEEDLSGYAELHQYESNQFVSDYADYNYEKKSLVFEFTVRKYHASGTWTVRGLRTFDLAKNVGLYDLKEKAPSFSLVTSNPDLQKPELDLSAIHIKAVPRQPEAPNGETDVTIWYAAKDNNSGLGWVSYQLLKPTGDILFDYHYHENFHTPYFAGDPTEYKAYEIKLTLPPGSPPGTWVLQQLALQDKAGNSLSSNFIQTGIVKPFEVK